MNRLFNTVLMCLFLSSCASGPMKAPCSDFGAHCRKVPINAWDYHDAAVL